MDIDLGSGMDGTQAAKKILEKQEVLIIFLSPRTIDWAGQESEVVLALRN